MCEIRSEIFNRKDNVFVKRPTTIRYYLTKHGAKTDLERMIKDQESKFVDVPGVEVAFDTKIDRGAVEHITYVYPVGDTIDNATVYRTYITK